MRKILVSLIFSLSVLSQAYGAGQQKDSSVFVPEGDKIEVDGEFLECLQERDSILIGDQFLYGFVAKEIKNGTVLGLPVLEENPNGGVILLEDWKLDTLKTVVQNNGKPDLHDIRGVLKLTTFDEGEYELPPIRVLLNTRDGRSDTLVYDPVHIHVKTMPVDTASFIPNDVSPQIRMPLSREEAEEIVHHNYGKILIVKWSVILLILIVCIVIVCRSDKYNMIARKKEPAYIVALRRLDSYKSNSMWVPEMQKEFYSGITDALKEYIGDRYGFGAMEMTTGELFAKLKKSDAPKDIQAEMKQLFERADYVKFAKYIASDEENATVVPVAVRFVTQTYQEVLEAEQAAAVEKGKKNK